MKFTVKIESDDEEINRVRLALIADELAGCIRETDEYLRSKLKHADLSEETYNELSLVRDTIWDNLPMNKDLLWWYMSYLKTIRRFCMECMVNQHTQIADCPSTRCLFYPYRMGTMPDEKPKYTPLKSIRLYCLECVGTSDEVKKCTMGKTIQVPNGRKIPKCPIFDYRFGRNHKLKGKRGKGSLEGLINYRKQKSTVCL